MFKHPNNIPYVIIYFALCYITDCAQNNTSNVNAQMYVYRAAGSLKLTDENLFLFLGFLNISH